MATSAAEVTNDIETYYNSVEKCYEYKAPAPYTGLKLIGSWLILWPIALGACVAIALGIYNLASYLFTLV
jgi:hypothetical protein